MNHALITALRVTHLPVYIKGHTVDVKKTSTLTLDHLTSTLTLDHLTSTLTLDHLKSSQILAVQVRKHI